jgi:hypothetical protein
MNFSIQLLLLTCFFDVCYAADDTNYTVYPYDHDRDYNDVDAIISSNIKKLCTQLNQQPMDSSEQKKRSEKRYDRLKNNTNCSPLLKPLGDKFFRIVLRNQHKVVGTAHVFENAVDWDCIKKHDGYSEEILTDEQHTAQYPILIDAILKKCTEIGIKRLVHHLIDNAMHEFPEYKSLLAVGFTTQTQTDFEKQNNIIRFEKILQD